MIGKRVLVVDDEENLRRVTQLKLQQAGYEATCMLDPKDPLIVTHSPSEDESGEVIIAQVQGKSTIEWPFCPPQAELLVKRHHITQQPSILQDIRDGLLRLFKPS